MKKVVNDFTINIATANGTGSQSANLILLNALFKMGTHASVKIYFLQILQDCQLGTL